MTYEQGFADGERQAFEDARKGIVRQAADPSDAYGRGFFDGYTPRSSSWRVYRRDDWLKRMERAFEMVAQ